MRQIRDAIRLARSLLSKIPTSLQDLAGLLSDLLGLCGRERVSGRERYKQLQQQQYKTKLNGQFLSEAAAVDTGVKNDINSSTSTMSPKEKRDTWTISGALKSAEDSLSEAANANLFSRMTAVSDGTSDPNYKTSQTNLQSTEVEFTITPQPLRLRRR